MTENSILTKLEEALKEISFYEKKGFDASSLKIFIKNFKEYLRVTEQNQSFSSSTEEMVFEKKLKTIQDFLNDKNMFKTIKDVIEFANTKLNLEFKNPKAKREITVSKIITQIRRQPELKETLKSAVISLRNEKSHSVKPKSKKEIISVEKFDMWAEIIKNI